MNPRKLKPIYPDAEDKGKSALDVKAHLKYKMDLKLDLNRER